MFCSMRALFLVLLSAPAAMPAQPVIFAGGVVNAAGYLPAGSPGGAIAQGSIFSIFGAHMGPAAKVQPSGFPLDTVLAGVSVLLTHQSGAVMAAIPLFVSDGQINAIMPSSMPVGLVAVSVSFKGALSSAELIKVVRSSFGTFTQNSAGSGPAIARNYVSAAEQPLNSPARPAMPGQTVVLWGTGLAPIAGQDNVAPTPANLNEPVAVTLAGRPVSIDYRGRSGCCAGVDQINFRVPNDAPLGCALPLVVELQNGVYSNITTLAVSPDGAPCSDAWNLPGQARKWGEINLVRATSDTGATSDAVTGAFAQGGAPARFPMPGTCASVAPAPGLALDAGPQLTLAGPQGSRQITRTTSGQYLWNSGGDSSFLGPGDYTVAAPGGADVGPLSARLREPAPASWSGASGTRTSGLTLSWTGGDAQNEFAVISGPGFFCTAGLDAGSFALPAPVLANAPAQAMVSLGAVTQTFFASPGLDQAVFRYTQWAARAIAFGQPPLPSSPVLLPNGRRILAELAVTSAEQERGLMQRASLAPDRGMLFLFNQPDYLEFWMYQTLIPLDILWLDQNRRIVFIAANTPPCASANSANCPTYGGRQLAQYVLEIGAGRAAQYGLQTGDQLDW